MTWQATFAKLIAPLDPAQFLGQHWEQEPAHVQRNDAAWYADMFSSARLEHVLRHAQLRPTDVRVVLRQNEVPPARYTLPDGSLHLNQIYKAYGEGHTLVINGLQRFDAQIAGLARALRELTSFQVEFNVYLTPPDSQGLHPHYDTHDVFALQIEGRKNWQLYGSAEECPLLNTFQPVFAVEQLPGAARTVELCAGDMLYLPRGHVHDAYTTTSESMHITIGLYPTQWVDLLQTALTQLALRDVRYRRAVPIGYLNKPQAQAELKETLAALLADFAARAPLDIVPAAQEQDFIRQSTPAADDHFASLHAANGLRLHDWIERRAFMRCHLADSGTEVRLHYPGNVFRATADYRQALAQVAALDAPIQVRDLQGAIDDGRRLVLAQRLIRGGLLRVAAGSASGA
jgi:ribosomal protein L16 Arg81 hydroxylase